MGGSRTAAKATKAAKKKDAGPEDEGPGPAVIEDLSDMTQIKRVFEDTTIEIIHDMGYEERHTVTDVKILLGAVCIAFALYAQFHPAKFPDNWNVLAACVVGYLTFNAVLTLYTTFIERGAIIFTKPRPGAGASADVGLAVRCKMPRFSEAFTVVVCRADAGADPGPGAAEGTANVCDYVYEDGTMAVDAFAEMVKGVVGQFERGEGRKTK